MEITRFDDLYARHNNSPLAPWLTGAAPRIAQRLNPDKNKLTARLTQALDTFLVGSKPPVSLRDGVVQAGKFADGEQENITASLRCFKPWRKGPWQIGDVFVDSEWDSRIKWNRICEKIDLHNRRILDIGCGNGYYAYRMYAAGAREIIGIDPGLAQVFQALLIQKISAPSPISVLPLGIEDMPQSLPCFDTVFSMGVLYHRKSPVEHLQHIRNLLRPGGQLVLETLIVDDTYADMLIPEDRYAQMPNVWFVPSVKIIERLLRRLKFEDITLCDVSLTTEREQRKTDWVDSLSLSDFIYEDTTVEGYPRPKRAVITARKKL
ncbi:MAG: tRNA 5-methoxyuridine(34)/uridine 5-oxyacetic acid(34) synthase CmoB [Fibrobacterota bacterium]